MIINYEFDFLHHTKICFGEGAVNRIGGEAELLGSKALIVCDPGVRKAGIVDKVESSLKESNIDYVIFDEIMPNPRDTSCAAAAELGKANNVDIVIGIGGGSAMDTAKAADVLITNGHDCVYWAVQTCPDREFEHDPLPIICVPTTCGTGSEVTFEAVITNEATTTKVSISDGARLAPQVAIMDPALTLSVPPLVLLQRVWMH